jgi:hypothetical protein
MNTCTSDPDISILSRFLLVGVGMASIHGICALVMPGIDGVRFEDPLTVGFLVLAGMLSVIAALLIADIAAGHPPRLFAARCLAAGAGLGLAVPIDLLVVLTADEMLWILAPPV